MILWESLFDMTLGAPCLPLRRRYRWEMESTWKSKLCKWKPECKCQTTFGSTSWTGVQSNSVRWLWLMRSKPPFTLLSICLFISVVWIVNRICVLVSQDSLPGCTSHLTEQLWWSNSQFNRWDVSILETVSFAHCLCTLVNAIRAQLHVQVPCLLDTIPRYVIFRSFASCHRI